MKKYILCCLVLIAFASSYAQDVQTVKSDWTVASENKIVVVSKRTVQLDDVKNGLHREYVQFKYKNKTAQQVGRENDNNEDVQRNNKECPNCKNKRPVIQLACDKCKICIECTNHTI